MDNDLPELVTVECEILEETPDGYTVKLEDGRIGLLVSDKRRGG